MGMSESLRIIEVYRWAIKLLLFYLWSYSVIASGKVSSHCPVFRSSAVTLLLLHMFLYHGRV